MGTVYEYLWAVVGNWWWCMTAILFVIDKFLEWVWKDYRNWLTKTFSTETRRKFFWRTVFAFVLVSGFLAWREEHEKVVSLQKTINTAAAASASQRDTVAQVRVTKEGVLSVGINRSEYGLAVKKIEFEGGPAYTLTFEKEPEYFRVDVEDRATVEVVRVGPNSHRVKFVGVSRVRPAIEADFLVTMYPLNM